MTLRSRRTEEDVLIVGSGGLGVPIINGIRPLIFSPLIANATKAFLTPRQYTFVWEQQTCMVICLYLNDGNWLWVVGLGTCHPHSSQRRHRGLPWKRVNSQDGRVSPLKANVVRGFREHTDTVNS
ncbi:hypothetical protein ARMGADRAFT_1091729 [Armillaria gallica]|uniref:Uncharacterized protein n=1 Tax=Armillaria gallica TaxID=47427 RepID=A0A2H3CW17_ARMGA|nr:hypothetical protein ARMGADRAFT_1091729 [Armillaria gallica]